MCMYFSKLKKKYRKQRRKQLDRCVLRRISNRLNYSEISFGWARQSVAACLQSKVEFCLLQCIFTTFPFPLTAGSTISVHVVISNVDTIIFRAFQSNEIIIKKTACIQINWNYLAKYTYVSNDTSNCIPS